MKKTIKPTEEEESVYYSDFTGKPITNGQDVLEPPVVATLEFNYGSEQDGRRIELHLNDDDACRLLDCLEGLVSEDRKGTISLYDGQGNIR